MHNLNPNTGEAKPDKACWFKVSLVHTVSSSSLPVLCNKNETRLQLLDENRELWWCMPIVLALRKLTLSNPREME